MPERCPGPELPLLVLGSVITVAAVTLLIAGPNALGWILMPIGVLLVLAIGYRVKKRTDAIRNSGRTRSEELDYRHSPGPPWS